MAFLRSLFILSVLSVRVPPSRPRRLPFLLNSACIKPGASSGMRSFAAYARWGAQARKAKPFRAWAPRPAPPFSLCLVLSKAAAFQRSVPKSSPQMRILKNKAPKPMLRSWIKALLLCKACLNKLNKALDCVLLVGTVRNNSDSCSAHDTEGKNTQ